MNINSPLGPKKTFNRILWSLTILGLAGAASRLVWPNLKLDAISIGFLVFAALPWLPYFLKSAELPGGFKVEFLAPKPTTGIKGDALTSRISKEKLPPDYLFLNHTSFYLDTKEHHRKEQEEVRRKTGINRKHYHIHVIVDSYYKDALNQVDYVEYILHRAYPEPLRRRSKVEDKFLLKEMANGEYVLFARVYLKEVENPLILSRYITLWDSGPTITET